MTKHGLHWSEDEYKAQLAKTARLTAQQVTNRDQPFAPAQMWAEPKPAKNKYKNIHVEVDGIKFPSRLQAKRYGELKLREKAGEIRDLKLSTKWTLDINGVHICNYIDDFSWWEGDKHVVADAKGVRTPAYRLKCKLMRALYGVTILEL